MLPHYRILTVYVMKLKIDILSELNKVRIKNISYKHDFFLVKRFLHYLFIFVLNSQNLRQTPCNKTIVMKLKIMAGLNRRTLRILELSGREEKRWE